MNLFLRLIPRAAVVGTLTLAAHVAAQTIVLDDFNSGTRSGSAFGAWATAPSPITLGATTITVGTPAQDISGWGSSTTNHDASTVTYVRVTARRDAGQPITNSLIVQLDDPNLATTLVSAPMSAFSDTGFTHVLIPITWDPLFDPSRTIAGWNIGGGVPAPGSSAFRMTFDHLALVSGLSLQGGGTFATIGNQVYSGAQTLTAATTLNTAGTEGNAVTFSSTVDGGHALTINTSGATTLAAAVGNTTPLASVTTDAGGTTAINGGKVITTGAQTYNDSVSLGADTQIKTTVSGVISFVEALVGNNHSLLIESPDAVAFNAASGLTSLTKTGVGTMTMTGTSTYTGATNVNGGILNLTGSATSSAFTVNTGARLMGTGSLGGLGLMSGGTLAPGASTGTLSAGNSSFAGGSFFNFELSNATGTRGTSSGWDLLSVGGSLSLGASAGNPFTLRLSTLNGSASGLAANFNAASNYSFTFVATTGGVTGFATNAFAFDTTGFQNPFSGTWSVGQNGNDLVLNYSGASAIPEPSTYAAIAGACALGLAVWQRRRSRSGAGSPPEFLV